MAAQEAELRSPFMAILALGTLYHFAPRKRERSNAAYLQFLFGLFATFFFLSFFTRSAPRLASGLAWLAVIAMLLETTTVVLGRRGVVQRLSSRA